MCFEKKKEKKKKGRLGVEFTLKDVLGWDGYQGSVCCFYRTEHNIT